MPDVDLDKLSPELRAALERELAPKPQRSDAIGVSFTYDPDDLESVKKGVARGHLTREEAVAWGHPEDAFGKPADDDDDDDTDDGKGKRGRGGYFGG